MGRVKATNMTLQLAAPLQHARRGSSIILKRRG
ncbi:hypothetical protein L917_10834 [Phytophthora nicotianae]|uniref:Uncharacterized protein n=1 Tax=Phytophthora nicotianae TaxID=4792 RepID=W2IVA6_PHYNI|nr:hypothetical protein L915_11028 [Phytophthora nicotianae]ETL37328.1 hypothetical protein L916_10927 [Phytophthora nicotianae]ETL90489.1 hypothetical protein L917_10834 [Phytophthora nicotianae]